MTDLAPIAPKLCKLIPRLATEQAGEVVATVRAIQRTLAAEGLDLHDLARAIEAPRERIVYLEAGRDQAEPQTWVELARWILKHDEGRLKTRERAFARSMVTRLVVNGEPTAKQAAWLRVLYGKLAAQDETGGSP